MTRAAVIAGDERRYVSQRRTNAHSDGLLAAIGMGAAEHRFSLVKLFEFLFERAHQNHLSQHVF